MMQSYPQIRISPVEIYKGLNKSNCGDCQVKTCFAFASMVCQGQKAITDCPYLSEELANQFGCEIEKKKSFEEEQEEALAALVRQVANTDLPAVAGTLGGVIKENKLVIKCLGKSFFIDIKGNVSSEIHVHSWIKGPILNYVVRKSEVGPSGKWVVFKQLPSGERWNPLYMQRCEKALLKVADENEELFPDVLSLFGKITTVEGIMADQITLHYPLPKIPVLVCYSRPEDGFDSSLLFYYDEKAEEIVNIESIYSLSVGMTMMIEKIIRRHG